MATTTPNMNLIESTIGVDSGLLWEQNLNSSLTLIDQHNHAPGFGVQITPAGLNINSSLAFNNFAATNLSSIVLNPQTSLATLYAVYSIGKDLYFNDGNSNVIQLTSGGAVNATTSGISSGAATASFVSSVLVVNAAANTPANIQVGSVLLGNNLAASKFLTLSPPSAMAANFTLTLPSVPAATNLVTLDTSGNFAAVTNVDNSSLQLSSNLLGIKAQGVLQSALALRATGSTVAAGGIATSSSSGSFTTGSVTPVAVTNLSVTITTLGRPVRICCQSDNSGNAGAIQVTGSGSTIIEAFLEVVRGGTAISKSLVGGPSGASATNFFFAPSAIDLIDIVAAGTYTYTINVFVGTFTGTNTMGVSNLILVAYET